MPLSIISTVSAEDLWKIYTYFILKLFSKCHTAQQKTTGTLLRGQQAQHRALQDAQPQQTLQAKGLCGHKTPQWRLFLLFLGKQKTQNLNIMSFKKEGVQ